MLYRISEDKKGENGGELARERVLRNEREVKRKEVRKRQREILGRYLEGRSCQSGGTFVAMDEGSSKGNGRLNRVVGVVLCLVMFKDDVFQLQTCPWEW